MSSVPTPSQDLPLVLMDRGCPFAHRVVALLEHLGVRYAVRQAPPGQDPDRLRQWSSSGRLPLLVHQGRALGESRVILEYLAEVFHFASTRPANALERALESEAMALVDTILVPRLLTSDSDVKPRLVECLEVIEGAVARTANPSLLTFHAAPVWLRFQWWHPAGAVTTQIRRHSRLRAWLDAAAANHGIVKTAPDPAQNIADFSSLFPTA